MASPRCPVCHHPTRSHAAYGCVAAGGTCECTIARASLADAFSDSPAGADGGSPGRPRGDLPGADPAPVEGGHEAASLFRGGEAGPAPERLTPDSGAGAIPLGTTWLCRAHRATAAGPGRCPTCDEPLRRHHLYAEAADS